tara:strand:- start:11658 stop:12569 length:912 start_codon:yes stop_codon:yes gene_type:complete
MPQTATTGNLANVQKIIINAARYVQEHKAPSWQLIDKVSLPKGASTVRIPKVGQFTIAELVDGQDMTDEQSIGLTSVDLTTSEKGAKIIITDKLMRQHGSTDVMSIIGRQFGDAGARKQDRDTQALYSGLNGGTAYGAAGSSMGLSRFAGAIARSRGGGKSGSATANETGSEPFDPTYAVHHPHSVFDVTASATAIGAGTKQAVNDRREEAMLKNFFKISFNGVDLFESGNLDIDSSGDVTGVIAQRDALIGITSVGWHTERQRDASARGWEVNFTSDYDVFEQDDKHGAPLLYDATVPGTSS